MLVPFLLSGLDLYAAGISDPESIDIAWTRGTGAPKGPFQIFDTVGLNTAYNIVHQYQSVPGIFSPLLKKMMRESLECLQVKVFINTTKE